MKLAKQLNAQQKKEIGLFWNGAIKLYEEDDPDVDVAKEAGVTPMRLDRILTGKWNDTPADIRDFLSLARRFGVTKQVEMEELLEIAKLEARASGAPGTKSPPKKRDKKASREAQHKKLMELEPEEYSDIIHFLETLLYDNREAHFSRGEPEPEDRKRALAMARTWSEKAALRSEFKALKKQPPAKDEIGKAIDRTNEIYARLWAKYHPGKKLSKTNIDVINSLFNHSNAEDEEDRLKLEAACEAMDIPFNVDWLRREAEAHATHRSRLQYDWAKRIRLEQDRSPSLEGVE